MESMCGQQNLGECLLGAAHNIIYWRHDYIYIRFTAPSGWNFEAEQSLLSGLELLTK